MSTELEALKLKCLRRWGEEIVEFYTRISRTILRTVDYTCIARRRRGLRMIKGDLEFYNLPSLSFDDLVDYATADVKEDLQDDVAEYNSLISGLMAETAQLIAAHVHKDQRDKLGYPYLAHVKHVAKTCLPLGQAFYLTGLLHDALEDAKPNEQEPLIDMLKRFFPAEVYEAVLLLTKSSHMSYEEYLERVKSSRVATQVKIADAKHNLGKAHLLRSITESERLEKKYMNALVSLGEEARTDSLRLEYINGQGWRRLAPG